MKHHYDLIVVGGGAAGFYASIHTALLNPQLKIALLEQSGKFLSKVKVSGGGRCNVTNQTYDPQQLVKNYPRGNKALLGPFYTHGPEQVVDFFEANQVPIVAEQDGRMFPQSNSSSSIVECLLSLAKENHIELITHAALVDLQKKENHWSLTTHKETYSASKILITTGSNKAVWKLLQNTGIKIVDPVPSLFTFNIDDLRLENLAGISAEVSLEIETNSKEKIQTQGPLLITHWGLSGPAVLKASAWGARALYDLEYQFQIKIHWLPHLKKNQIEKHIEDYKQQQGSKTIIKNTPFELTKRLWKSLVDYCGIPQDQQWAQLNSSQRQNLIEALSSSVFQVNGKSTFKEEFVSAGGVHLDTVNFKNMESKTHPGLYFAGEVLDIDAITGGFNFQNAWTTAYIAALDIAILE